MVFSILGSLVAFTVPLMLVVSGVLSALPLLLVFWGTRERETHMAQERPGLLQSLRAARQNHPFIFSLVTLMQKVASSLAVPLALMVLDITGYVLNAPQQLPGALWGIRVIIGPVPAVLLCAGILFALRYPLTRERHAEVRHELDLRRANL